jgi:hypothetical protein
MRRTPKNVPGDQDRNEMKMLIWLAHVHKHDCLILGAWGELRLSPPGHVAKIMVDMVRRYSRIKYVVSHAPGEVAPRKGDDMLMDEKRKKIDAPDISVSTHVFFSVFTIFYTTPLWFHLCNLWFSSETSGLHQGNLWFLILKTLAFIVYNHSPSIMLGRAPLRPKFMNRKPDSSAPSSNARFRRY